MPAHPRTTTPNAPTPPARFVDRQLRPDADRSLKLGVDLLIGALAAAEGVLAGDTAESARRLADALEEGVSQVVKARRLYGQRADVR